MRNFLAAEDRYQIRGHYSFTVAPEMFCLTLTPICRFGGLLQLGVRLFEQRLGFLGVAGHVPFVGSLSGGDALESLLAEALRGCQIRVASGTDVVPWTLGEGDSEGRHQDERGRGEKSEFDHVSHCKAGFAAAQSPFEPVVLPT